MNPCKDCIVDMVCIKKCPIFEIDLDRLQTDVLIYTKRCMNNIENGTKYWYKNNKRHRDNHKPAIIDSDGSKRWYKNGVRYEFM